MQNFRLSNYGAALKRLGTAITNSFTTGGGGVLISSVTTFNTTNSVYSGIYWPSKSTIYVVAAAAASRANTIWKSSYPSSNTFPITWTSVSAVGIQWRPCIFTDSTQEITYYAGDPTAAVQKFDGTSVSSLTTSTAQVIGLCVFNDRLWGWNGGTGKENYLYYSNLSSAVGSIGGDSLGLIASGGGLIIIRTFGMSAIRACLALGGSLMIFHDRGISRLTGFGQDDTTVTPNALTSDVGMANGTPSGLCEYGGIIYFVTDRGIYRCTEATVGPLATPTNPDPTIPLLQAGVTDPSQFILRFNRQFNELWVDSGAGIFVYSVILQAWAGPFTRGPYNHSTNNTLGLRDFFEVVEPASLGGNPKLWTINFNGDGGNGLWISETDRTGVYGDSTTTDSSGQPIVGILQLHRMFGGDRIVSKSWRWVNILTSINAGSAVAAPQPTCVITAQLGGASTHNIVNQSVIESPIYIPAAGMGPWIDATINDSNAGSQTSYALATVQGNILGQR